MLVLVWAADSPAIPTDWLAVISQYGVLGITTGALFLFARAQIKREQDRSDRLEAQLTQLHAATADKVIPALVSATQVLQDTQYVIRELRKGP